MVALPGHALAQPAPAAERARAREIFRELIEIPTTAADAATTRAAQAMADRLTAAGFPPADVRVLGPNPRTGNLVARFRGTDARLRPMLLMAHIDVVPALREDWSVDPWTLTRARRLLLRPRHDRQQGRRRHARRQLHPPEA